MINARTIDLTRRLRSPKIFDVGVS